MCVCVCVCVCACVCSMYHESGDQWGVDRLSVEKQAGGVPPSLPPSLSLSLSFPLLIFLSHSGTCSTHVAQGHCNTMKVWKVLDTRSSRMSQHFSTLLCSSLPDWHKSVNPLTEGIYLNCTASHSQWNQTLKVFFLYKTSTGLLRHNSTDVLRFSVMS